MEQQKADWYPDPEQPGRVRWWDGRQWTNRWATPVLVPEMQQIRDDLRFIRSVVFVWVILTVLGLFLLFVGAI